MPITREAKYLAPADLGKTIEGTDVHGGKYQGQLVKIETTGLECVCLTVRQGFYGEDRLTRLDAEVTIAGIDTPAGLNLHKPVTEQEQP